MNHAGLALVLALAVAPAAHAQKLLTIGNATYPADQLLPGIEAKVMVAITVSAAGTPEGASVSESSGFPPLDKAAQDVAMTARFAPATDKEGRPVAVKAILPVSFAASSSPLHRPCSGLTNEIAEFKRFNPALAPDDLKSVAVINGALVSGLFSQNAAGSMVDRIKNLKAVSDEIYKQCAAEPKSIILDVIRGAVKTMKY